MCLCWMNVKEMCVKKNSGEKKKNVLLKTLRKTRPIGRVFCKRVPRHTLSTLLCVAGGGEREEE